MRTEFIRVGELKKSYFPYGEFIGEPVVHLTTSDRGENIEVGALSGLIKRMSDGKVFIDGDRPAMRNFMRDLLQMLYYDHYTIMNITDERIGPIGFVSKFILNYSNDFDPENFSWIRKHDDIIFKVDPGNYQKVKKMIDGYHIEGNVYFDVKGTGTRVKIKNKILKDNLPVRLLVRM